MQIEEANVKQKNVNKALIAELLDIRVCSECSDENSFFLNNKLFGLCKGKKTEKINFEKFSFKTFSFLTCKTLKEDICKKISLYLFAR